MREAPRHSGLRGCRDALLAIAWVLPALAGCGGDEGFQLLHVSDVVAMLNAGGSAVTVLDANGPDFRAREGVIPGAVLLSSYSKYDAGKELPPGKDQRLVFYCADSH